MSATLEEKLKAIEFEVRALHFKWKDLTQLFGDEQKLEVLNATAPSIFRSIQDSMLHDIILSIARLTDPLKSSGYKNLSFESILAEVSEPSLRAEISAIISEMNAKVAAIRDWRDKKLAHNDLAKAVEGTTVLPIQVADLTKVLTHAGQILNIFHKRFYDTTVLYEESITAEGGDALLFYLEYGLDAWNEDKKNLNMDRLHKLREKWAAIKRPQHPILPQ